MKTLSSLSCALALSGACAAANAQVTIPNTFQSGTPARAADVNANFSAVKAAVDANAADIAALEQLADGAFGGIAVAVDGVHIGTLLSIAPRVGLSSDPNTPTPTATVLYPASIGDTPALWVLTATGYVVAISAAPEYGAPFVTPPVSGMVLPSPMLYPAPNCDGDPIILAPMAGAAPRPPVGPQQLAPLPGKWFANVGGGGGVFRAPDPTDPKTYMASSTTPLVPLSAASFEARATNPSSTGETVCTNFANPITGVGRLLVENDPAVTGVPNGMNGGRITLDTY
jgi:hypothetical protein